MPVLCQSARLDFVEYREGLGADLKVSHSLKSYFHLPTTPGNWN